MQDNSPQRWEQLYEAAVLETDDSKLPGKIREARAEIKRSLEKLEELTAHAPDGDASALEKALIALAFLENERLNGKA